MAAPAPPRPSDPDDLLRHARFVKALARELARDESEADELAARTMAEAVARRPGAGPGLRVWLRRVLWRIFRRERRDEERRLRLARSCAESAGGAAAAVAPASVDLVARIELEQAIASAFAALEEPCKSTLFLRFYDDRTPAQIAAQTGTPVETVKTRLKRGLQRLRARLDARAKESGDPRGEWRAIAIALAKQGGPVAALAKGKVVVAAAAVVVVAGAAAWMRADRHSGARLEALDAGRPVAVADETSVDRAGVAEESGAPAAIAKESAPRRTEERPLPFASGLVVDEHGAPIAGARVVASFANRDVRRRHGYASPLDFARLDGTTLACSDRDGRFAVASAPDDLAGLWFIADGHAPAASFDLSTIAAENQQRSVTLEVGGLLKGRIHDHEGRPVLGAWIRASDFSPRPVAFVPGSHPLAPGCDGPQPGFLAGQSCVDADGCFGLLLPCRACRIDVGAPGYTDDQLEFEPGSADHDVTLWRHYALLDVVDARSRAPVPAVHALVLRMDRPEYESYLVPAQQWELFPFDLAKHPIPSCPARLIVPASAQLVLFADGYRSKSYELAIASGDEPPHEILALEPGDESVALAGVVHGARAARVDVRWVRRSETNHFKESIARKIWDLEENPIDRQPPLSSRDVGEDGRFSFRGLPAGTYCVDVLAAGRTPRRRVVTAPVTDLEFDLAASARLEVAVVDASGAPCPDVPVHVQTAHDDRAWSRRTDADGLAIFGTLPDTDLRMVSARELHDLDSGGVAPFQSTAFSFEDDVTLSAGETRRVILKIVEPLPVTLFIHDVQMHPTEGASVAVSLGELCVPGCLVVDAGRDFAGRILETDSAGELQLELWPTAHVFEVWAHGHHFHSHVAIWKQRAQRIDLELTDD